MFMYEERSSNWFSLCNVSQPISQSVSLSSNNLDNYCATLHYDNHNVDYCILAYCGSISSTWSHSCMYTYLSTFKKVKVVCQASLVEEKELFELQTRCNCCYKYTQCNLFYTEMHEKFSANKTHKFTLVTTEYET